MFLETFLTELAQAKLAQALSIEEDFWRQKSACKWLQEDDRNTKFFHNLVKSNRKKAHIRVIKEGDACITDPIFESLSPKIVVVNLFS